MAAVWRDRQWRLKGKQKRLQSMFLPDAWIDSTEVRIRSYGWEDSRSQKIEISDTIRASTVRAALDETQAAAETPPAPPSSRQALNEAAGSILRRLRLSWKTEYELQEVLGIGGQGVVFLTECRGSDGFSFPMAMKVFFPWNYPSPEDYERAMQRIAHAASVVAQIRQPNLMDVSRFEQRQGVRVMLMELVDGYDLRRLLVPKMLDWLRNRVDAARWKTLNEVTVTAGPDRARLLPGPAVMIIRACLGALAALHGRQLVHGDVKPANIMLDCNGHPKIIDIGSAFEYHQTPEEYYTLTWEYAAPEIHRGESCSPQSDLTSLGYVLIELLSGRSLFGHCQSREALLEAKLALPGNLRGWLPSPVCDSRKLMELCRRLIEPDLRQRFRSAEEADLDPKFGAHAFLLELYRGHLGAAWDHDLHLWIKSMKS